MRLDKYLASLFAAGILLGSPTKGVADEFFSAPTDSTESAAETRSPNNPTAEPVPAVPFEMVAVDYCYQGSLVDPVTGESVDLFVLCAEDGVEQNIDLA
jgi:hypothetical protein